MPHLVCNCGVLYIFFKVLLLLIGSITKYLKQCAKDLYILIKN